MSYAHAEMTEAQRDEFLAAPRHAILATSRTGGSPQLSPVWYLYEDGKIIFSFFPNSAKYRNMVRDPRVAVCVDGGHPDARAVMFYGTVELFEEREPWIEEIEWRLIRRYHDSDQDARRYAASLPKDATGILAILEPDRILTQDYN